MRIRPFIATIAAGLSGCFFISSAIAQELSNPLDFPILLSGNFGELRSNHFHSGIDFKTQGVVGKPIHAVQDGYVSRLSVSPWGYGNALYLNHPDGTTTVYGHLLRYFPELASYLRQQQYEKETFSINLTFSPDQFPVKRGDIIAYSGNTGSSGGPHLHFEVRDTETEEVMDPLFYYKDRITDTRPPRIQGIIVYPMEGKGVVNGSSHKRPVKLVTSKNGTQAIVEKIQAWGDIALGVKAYDFMDNTSNIYGVREITLKLDSQVVYHADLDRYAFDETRYLNSYVDYEEWISRHSFYMRSYVEPGNRLRFIQSTNMGIVTIDEEKTYHLTYELADLFGNSTRNSVWIEGKKQTIAPPDTAGRTPFYWNTENRFGAKGIRLTIPKGNLYDDLNFFYDVKESPGSYASIHCLHDKPLALHSQARLSLWLRADTLPEKRQYGIARVRDGRYSWVGGVYRNGWIDTDIREFGCYTIVADTIPPTINPVNPSKWIANKRFVFALSDNMSGVASYRGEIDGKFVLFEMNNRSIISYALDRKEIPPGEHLLHLKVTDGCGNLSEYSFRFK